MICKVCNKIILINEYIAILSYPLQSVSKNAEYRFEDFLRNQTIIHFDCLDILNRKRWKDLRNNELYEEVQKILKSLGEKADTKYIEQLALDGGYTTVEGIVKNYFKI